MAVTATFTEHTNGRQRSGRNHFVYGALDPVGTYETGGFAITAGLFGLNSIESVLINGDANNGTEFMVAKWDRTNSKIKLGWGGATASSEFDEITNGDTCTGFVMDVTVRGR